MSSGIAGRARSGTGLGLWLAVLAVVATSVIIGTAASPARGGGDQRPPDFNRVQCGLGDQVLQMHLTYGVDGEGRLPAEVPLSSQVALEAFLQRYYPGLSPELFTVETNGPTGKLHVIERNDVWRAAVTTSKAKNGWVVMGVTACNRLLKGAANPMDEAGG